jgi:hypothetical protein
MATSASVFFGKVNATAKQASKEKEASSPPAAAAAAAAPAKV